MKGLIHHYPVIGWLLFISAFVLAGIPPFSGFIGKLLLLRGALSADEVVITIIALLSSLLILYSVMKIFIRGFWGEKDDNKTYTKKVSAGFIMPIVCLLVISVFLGLGAQFVYPAVDGIAEYLLDPQIYIDSVLKE